EKISSLPVMSFRSVSRLISFGRHVNGTILTSRIKPLNNRIPKQNPSLLCRYISSELKATLDGSVQKNDLVIFMKGTPEKPQCGFSRAVIQVFDTQ
ncbi:12359_t:CDS:2, partial [Acaulospora morrowiae]